MNFGRCFQRSLLAVVAQMIRLGWGERDYGISDVAGVHWRITGGRVSVCAIRLEGIVAGCELTEERVVEEE